MKQKVKKFDGGGVIWGAPVSTASAGMVGIGSLGPGAATLGMGAGTSMGGMDISGGGGALDNVLTREQQIELGFIPVEELTLEEKRALGLERQDGYDAFAYADMLDALGIGDTSQAAFDQAAAADLASTYALGMMQSPSAAAAQANAMGNIVGTAKQTAQQAGTLAGDILGTEIPGLRDIEIVDDVVTGIGNIFAKGIDFVVNDVLDLGTKNTVVVDENGNILVDVKFDPSAKSSGPQQAYDPLGRARNTTVGTSGIPGIILSGGTVGEAAVDSGAVTTIQEELAHATLSLLCKEGERYDRQTFSCVSMLPGGQQGATTTTTTTTKTCADGSTVGANDLCPEEKSTTSDETDSSKGSTSVIFGGSGPDCSDPYVALTDPRCFQDVFGTGENTEGAGVTDSVQCWDGTFAESEADCPDKPPAKVECWDGSFADTLEDCPDKPPEKVECWDGTFADTLEDCPDKPPAKVECWDGSFADTLEDCPDKPPAKVECPDGSFADSEEDCPTVTNYCLDPAFAAAYPELCGKETTGVSGASGGRRRLSREQVGTAEIPYIYDITTGEYVPLRPTINAAKGGKIDNIDLVDELSRLLGD
jgi:hypothetical protein